MFDLLGRLVTRHPRAVVLVWAVLAVGALLAAFTGLAGESLFDRLRTGEPRVPGSESQQAREILEDQGESGQQVTLLVQGTDLSDAATATAVGEALAPAHEDLAAIDGVDTVVDPFLLPDALVNPAAAGLVSTEQDGFLLAVTLEEGLDEDASAAAHDAVVERLEEVPGELRAAAPDVTGITSSGSLIANEIVEQVREDLVTGETVALPVSLLIMVVVFGGFLAAGMPLVGAVASIFGGLGALLAISYAVDIDSFVINVVTVLGLGLSIDYGLLVVSRFREEAHRLAGEAGAGATLAAARRRRHRRSPLVVHAVRTTVATAGRTVLFSAITVAFAIAGLIFMRPDILKSVGAAGVAIILLAVLSAVTLVPAVVVLLGERLLRPSVLRRVPGLRRLVNGLGDVAPDEGFFSRLARFVHRHPWAVLIAVVAILAVLASPVTGLGMRNSTTDLLPRGSEQREYIAVLGEDYPAAAAPDLVVVADTDVAGAAGLAEDVVALPGVEEVRGPAPLEEHTVLQVFLEAEDAAGAEATEVMEAVRAIDPGYRTWVTGQAAGQADFTDALVDGLPLAAGVVVAAIFVLLFLMTGSVLVPLKALVINLFSLTASLGVTVWVFQEGHLADLLDFTPVPGLESSVVAIIVAFGFGLAMDYEVFLLSRIKEFWDLEGDNDVAVERGLQRSGRIITSAALVIVSVFAGFVAGELIVIKQAGVALAVTVLIDATLVRMLLVPATMTLLGRWNWWAPAPLARVHRRLGIVH